MYESGNVPAGADHSGAPWRQPEPKTEDCKQCDGAGGHFYSLCCQVECTVDAYQCPCCGEPTTWEACESCDGSGKIEVD